MRLAKKIVTVLFRQTFSNLFHDMNNNEEIFLFKVCNEMRKVFLKKNIKKLTEAKFRPFGLYQTELCVS